MNAPASATDRSAQRLDLPDGRQLGFAEWGAESGLPLIYLHAAMSSRLEWHLEPSWLAAAGIRLITVDRPGHGLSSPHPGGTPLQFAHDVAALLDRLGLARAGVIGYSAGGMYALACCSGLGERMLAAGIVSGVAPTHAPGSMAGMGRLIRQSHTHARRYPWLLGLEMRTHLALFRYAPEYTFGVLGHPKITGQPEFRQRFLAAQREGARQGVVGFVEDLRRLARDWGFALSDIRCPVAWWHGDRDRVSPLPQARALAESIPDLDFIEIAGGTHLLIEERIGEIVHAVATRCRERRLHGAYSHATQP
jgi:pimeloyl-ACP methyl ester carboxylesterase